MYEEFYGLTGSPFMLTPDARFFFSSKEHRKAIAHLTFGLEQGEGFVIVTGEVGAGKTTLVERLWSQLDRDTFTMARISTTQVSGNDLFRLAMAGFGISDPTAEKSELILRFEQMSRGYKATRRRCLLVVDEVQNLSLAALEELRMLSNITEGGQALMQTILLGQPQFRRMLGSPDLDQLRQRVLASYHLGPMTEDETRAYIAHRLTAVGWIDRPHWDDAAFAAVFAHTGGIPRRINRLCGRVMLFGALEENLCITAEMVHSTAGELERDLSDAQAGVPMVLSTTAEKRAPDPEMSHGAFSHGEISGRVNALEARFDRLELICRNTVNLVASRTE